MKRASRQLTICKETIPRKKIRVVDSLCQLKIGTFTRVKAMPLFFIFAELSNSRKKSIFENERIRSSKTIFHASKTKTFRRW